MRSFARCLVLAGLGSVVLWSPGSTQTMSSSGGVVPTSWGHIKAMYGVEDLVQSASANESGHTPVTQTPYEPWTLQPAQVVMQKFHIPTSDILAVQKVVAYQNGMPADSAMAVVTDKQWYYVSLTDRQVYNTEPPGFRLATEMDVYGYFVDLIADANDCQHQEWAVDFMMPVCMHPNGNNGFTEIVDAWATSPYCSAFCNGGICTYYLCGRAWDDSGTLKWYNYKSCSGTTTSKKVGKIVQKRWLLTWRNCYGYADSYIASLVRTHIRY